jgi:hypothetical protein
MVSCAMALDLARLQFRLRRPMLQIEGLFELDLLLLIELDEEFGLFLCGFHWAQAG